MSVCLYDMWALLCPCVHAHTRVVRLAPMCVSMALSGAASWIPSDIKLGRGSRDSAKAAAFITSL